MYTIVSELSKIHWGMKSQFSSILVKIYRQEWLFIYDRVLWVLGGQKYILPQVSEQFMRYLLIQLGLNTLDLFFWCLLSQQFFLYYLFAFHKRLENTWCGIYFFSIFIFWHISTISTLFSKTKNIFQMFCY